MNKSEAIRFAEDLETGAFYRGDVEQHKITLDIQSMVRGQKIAFEEYWDG